MGAGETSWRRRYVCRRGKQQTEQGGGHLVERSSHRGEHVLRPCGERKHGVLGIASSLVWPKVCVSV